jgi:hypothetical protein
LTANEFTREITLAVLDFKTLWQYFDIDAYPEPVKVYLDREIYSDPRGSGDAGPIKLPSPPKQFPWWMTVWSANLTKAIRVTYHTAMGPNGVTETPRMGWPDGGSPWRNSSNMAIQPVVKVAGRSGDIIDALEFFFKHNGQKSGILGKPTGGKPFEFSYEGHLMSSIWINGISPHYRSADCVVFGFMMDPLWKPNTAALRALFMGGFSLSEQDAALTEDGPSIASLAAEAGWEAERQAFWTSVQSYAAAE